MYKGKRFLAIIPARGGSKRLPRKNLLNLSGKPLITWSIKAGLNSKYIDNIVVTSDDEKILRLSIELGVGARKRPDYLASDTASTFDAVKDVINNMDNYDYIVLLQPTSPLRTEKHIDEAIELLETNSADAVISVCELEHSPLWANVLPVDGNMTGFLRSEIVNKRSQDLEPFYSPNGAIYICKLDKLLTEEGFFIKDKIFAYKMDKNTSVDIDEEIDFLLAEVLFNYTSILV